jgi:DNA-binding transcriptional MerR regulator
VNHDGRAQRYLAHEFAERAGVTVRTLHHYDRLGLLPPNGRTAAGFRLYGEADLARLQTIATLKLVGLPLKQIKVLLERGPSDLPTVLRVQRELIAERRRQLDRASQAIAEAERVLAATGALDWDALKKVIEAIDMSENWDWVKKYYPQDQLDELARRGTPELLEKGQHDWAELIRDVEAAAARGESPTSDAAKALAARWTALIDAFTGGNPAIRANLQRLYADQANWPANAHKPYSDAAEAFIKRVMSNE